MPYNRKSQHISPDEFAATMLVILKSYIGATRKTLCMETAQAYEFGSNGTTIAAALNETIDIPFKTNI